VINSDCLNKVEVLVDPSGLYNIGACFRPYDFRVSLGIWPEGMMVIDNRDGKVYKVKGTGLQEVTSGNDVR
jgi:hypothetical protein